MSLILQETSPGETRAVAFLPDETPLSIFIWRHPAFDPRAKIGETRSGIVRQTDKQQGLCFVDLDTGETGVFNLSTKHTPPPEGAHVSAEIMAESWAEKAARIRLCDTPPAELTCAEAFAQWQSRLPAEDWMVEYAETPQQFSQIDEAFENAQASAVSLPGGGRLLFDQTRALTAIDVDAGGGQGGATRLNEVALAHIARHVSLRRIGGLMIVDLVGAPKGKKAASLHAAFKSMLSDYIVTGADILPVSRLGLIECAFRRRYRPLSDQVGQREGDPLLSALRAIRDIKRLALEDRTSRPGLLAGTELYRFLNDRQSHWMGKLSDEFGQRFTLERDRNLADYAYKITA